MSCYLSPRTSGPRPVKYCLEENQMSFEVKNGRLHGQRFTARYHREVVTMALIW